ncbi:hypothetical protein [Calothrix sp. NIES-3974]|uniref:hypothetical protein n=1 Tax=Calothrix sp. NIES-3974 TaxID=2005462 RepID=UPI0012FE0B33|nr:hypothetical protein [Calothrix sp. NIES-3974]
MPAKQSFILFAIASMIAIPTGIASANQLNIQTPNVQMSLGSEGGVNIRTTQPRRFHYRERIRVYTPHRCRSNSYSRTTRIGRNTVSTSSVTRICN